MTAGVCVLTHLYVCAKMSPGVHTLPHTQTCVGVCALLGSLPGSVFLSPRASPE